jgi:hypothetical protein
MTKRWLGVLLLVGWLAMSGSAQAQEFVTPCNYSVGIDYLYYWMPRKTTLPPLVTSGNINDAIPGALGQPNTHNLIEGNVRPSGASGARLTFDWGGPEDNILSASFFFVDQGDNTRQIGGSGTDPVLAISRPFFDPNFGVPNADPVVVPRVQSGTVEVHVPRLLLGSDVALRLNTVGNMELENYCVPLIGARYVHLNEKLIISEQVADLPDDTLNPGNRTSLSDNFSATNDFLGVLLGLESVKHFGPVSLRVIGKVALGGTLMDDRISGNTVVSGPAVGTVSDGTRGLLVQPTNVGNHTRTDFGVIPEIDVKLVWELNDYIALDFGYEALFWNSVARADRLIDTTVNINAVADPGRLGTSPHPVAMFHSDGFWLQGIHFGVRFSF